MAGPSQLLQQDFLSYRGYTNEKMQLIDEKMDYFMGGMNELLKQRGSDNEEGFENPFGSKERGRDLFIGFLRDPRHEQERARRNREDDAQCRRRNQNDENEDEREN